MPRIFTLESPLEDQLVFRRLTGSEGLSEGFAFELDALAQSHSLPLQSLLGKPVTVRIEQQGGGVRYLNGLVAKAVMGGREADRHYRYELTVRPWLWLATRRADCRIFQLKSTPQIVREVLAPYGFPLKSQLSGTYPPREYCVQYNETDAAFVSRLMEFEGIYYYFEHESGRHTLVLCDGAAAHRPLPGYESIPFIAPDRVTIADAEHIDKWVPAQQIQPGRHEVNDYDFTKPRADLLAKRADPLGYSHDHYAVFEWPGGYSDEAQGERYSRVRLEELQAEHDRAYGHTDARAMAPGHLFELTRCPRQDQNREYLVVRCEYRFQENAYASKSGDGEVMHETQFVAQPSSVPYRAMRVTPKPRTNGPQTAVVTGPAGEEIWTDKYGRVKLQFHWDRYGKRDENSSCWVRVSNPWAGGGFGGIQVPRVGDEVIVDFMNGDPDYPLITGRVYNAERMPPWDLPASATQSGLLSRSTPGGTAEHANALRFEDRKGAEQLWMHAERNFDGETELDHTLTIGRDHTHSVGNDETMQVARNRQRLVGKDETVTIKNDRTHAVGANNTVVVGGNHSATVKGNSTHTVKAGNHQLIVAAGTHDVHVQGDSAHVVEAGSRYVTVKAGDYSASAAKAVLIHGKGDGVAMKGDVSGVRIAGSGTGVDIEGLDNGVGIEGTGERGVDIVGRSGGVNIAGFPAVQLTGQKDASLSAATVTISGQKVVLTTENGAATITLDASGITIRGTIAQIN